MADGLVGLAAPRPRQLVVGGLGPPRDVGPSREQAVVLGLGDLGRCGEGDPLDLDDEQAMAARFPQLWSRFG